MMKPEDKRKPLSVESQVLINELVNCASVMTSEFPMKASKARVRMEALKEKLQDRVRTLEDTAAKHGPLL